MDKKENTTHHTELMERSDINTLKKGDIVFVRAIVTNIEIDDWQTDVSVKEYCSYAHNWKATVNSVDVYPTLTEPKPDITITSKGEAKRIAVQNPELFGEVAESLGYVRKETSEEVELCGYYFSPSRIKKLWIINSSGEGMEIDEEKMVKALNDFWNREF